MRAGALAVFNLVGDVAPWGVVIGMAVALVIVAWLVARWLALRWQREANRLAAQLEADIGAAETTLATLTAESRAYPTTSGAPYQEPARRLRDLLETVAGSLDVARSRLETTALATPSEPSEAVPRPRLWFEPGAWHTRCARLRAAQAGLDHLPKDIAAAEALLRELRRKPLETAETARALRATLDLADNVIADLRASGLNGESLARVADALTAHRTALGYLPGYLLDSSESQILRFAQPTIICQIYQMLTGVQQEVYAHMETLEGWREAHARTGEVLETMQQGVAAATTCLTQIHDAIDASALVEEWRTTQAQAETLTQRFAAPSPDDFADLERAAEIAQDANRLIARLASLEALRGSLEARLTENDQRLEETERQLRQLAEAGRYPLDRVPFQVELDRLRSRVAATRRPAEQRTPERLEADLASAQVLDRQTRTLLARVLEAREQRRRLVRLLDTDGTGLCAADDPSRAATTVDWLTWARDLHERTHVYAPECWQGDEALSVTTVLADAEALAARRQTWVPARVDDLLAPDTLVQRVREVSALHDDIEAFQNRLDRVTRRLQQLQETEESTRAALEAVYGALDRLDIVAASILPSALSEEDNHWSQAREHLDVGYGLDVALGSTETGSVWEKAERVAQWIASCEATLGDWQRVLRQEIRAAVGALDRNLDELSAVAPLDEEPAVREAHEALEDERMHASGSLVRARRGTDPTQVADICVRQAGEIIAQLRSLAHLDQVAVALDSAVLTPLEEPVNRWRAAEAQADGAFGRLQMLEAQSGKLWPPLSCDTAPVKARFDRADRLRDRLYQEGTTLPRALALVEDLTRQYIEIGGLVAAREQAYADLRPQIDAILDRIDAWGDALQAYGKRHESDPDVVAAIRARLDEIEAAFTQLHVRYDQAHDLVPGPEAQHALETLWRQAYREVPVGAGNHVIPVAWIA